MQVDLPHEHEVTCTIPGAGGEQALGKRRPLPVVRAVTEDGAPLAVDVGR